MYPTKTKEFLARRAEEDERLYQLYGKPLESEHQGEFVAINADGEVILGDNPDDVLKQAVENFGSGCFALKTIGENTFGKWLCFNPQSEYLCRGGVN